MVGERILSCLLAFLLVAVAGSERASGSDEFDGQVFIEEGRSDTSWISGSGTLKFELEVVEGGAVDVFICSEPPTWEAYYYEGYDYRNVMSVKDEFPMPGDYATVYLVIDNTNSETPSFGNVTINMTYRLDRTTEDMYFWIGLVVGIIVLGVSVASFFTRRGEVASDATIQKKALRASRSGRTYSGPKASPVEAAPMASDSWCPKCGGRMYWGSDDTWPTCPKCER
jgi:hypothetical protein